MKHILTLNEYRNQLEIPFDGKHPLHDKPKHVHVLDTLVSMTKKFVDVDDYSSNCNSDDIVTYWEENKDKAFDTFKNDNIGENYPDVHYFFCEEYAPTSFPNFYNEEVNEYINSKDGDEHGLDMDIIRNFNLHDDVKEHLSEEGLEKFESDEFIKKFFNYRLDEKDVEFVLKKNITKNGLIPIWRAISYDKGKDNDIYDNVTKNYYGAGIFWSYDEGGAVPHGGGHGKTYVLHGLVKPEYINWESTIYKSVWYLNEEEEVELIDNMEGEVLIYGITEKGYTDKYNREVNLKKAMVVKV